MCFARNSGLGRYDGSRKEWELAYRAARVAKRDGIEPDSATSGVIWKAGLIVAHERAEHNDSLICPIAARLALQHIIDEILNG